MSLWSRAAVTCMPANGYLQLSDVRRSKVQASAFVFSALVCMFLSLGVVTLALLRAGRPCEVQLEEKVNPNTAPLASLMRLPGIGLARAAAIILYREDARGADAAGPAFKNCDDLEKVRGLGPKTVDGMSEWLEFGQ